MPSSSQSCGLFACEALSTALSPASCDALPRGRSDARQTAAEGEKRAIFARTHARYPSVAALGIHNNNLGSIFSLSTPRRSFVQGFDRKVTNGANIARSGDRFSDFPSRERRRRFETPHSRGRSIAPSNSPFPKPPPTPALQANPAASCWSSAFTLHYTQHVREQLAATYPLCILINLCGSVSAAAHPPSKHRDVSSSRLFCSVPIGSHDPQVCALIGWPESGGRTFIGHYSIVVWRLLRAWAPDFLVLYFSRSADWLGKHCVLIGD